MTNNIALSVEGICKSFNRISVLNDISLELRCGEIHVLVGENGAGKSTLVKILTGIYTPDEGNIIINGKKVKFKSLLDARKEGIYVIHQELNLVNQLDVKGNIYLGKILENDKKDILGKFGFINWRQAYRDAIESLKLLNIDNINPNALVQNLGVSQKQIIEICSVLATKVDIVLMDEPTSSLSLEERDILFDKIRVLKDRGVAILYISHFLDEVLKIGDKITVIRDGNLIGTQNSKNITKDKIIEMMLGHKISNYFPKRKEQLHGKLLFRAEGIKSKKFKHPFSFELREGEILGIFGLVGSGRTELARAIFGADTIEGGKIYLEEKVVKINSPYDAINNEIGLLPDERLQGLHLLVSIEKNIILAALNKKRMRKELMYNFGIIKSKKRRLLAEELIKKLQIKANSPSQLPLFLSGGNRQKVIFSKWISSQSRVLILDEPTKGVDVGTKTLIFHIINDLALQGKGIIMISSEVSEVIAMCDRILVMHKGQIYKEFDPSELTDELLMKSATEGEVC
ncbi:MAG: sugar ABC transporter ATP-binding protein [Candidatus Humimicrobiaceae bacterium]